jgi:hypothetical protein
VAIVANDIQIAVHVNEAVTQIALKKPYVPRRPVVLPFGIRPVRRRSGARRQQQNLHGRMPSNGSTEQVADEGTSHSTSDSDSQGSQTSSSSLTSSSSSSSPDASEEDPEPVEAVALQIELQEGVVHEMLHGESPAQVTAKTFFNTHVGILDLSFAPARGKSARCFHCNLIIERGASRFSYSYDVKRPWKYIHGNCAVSFLKSLKSQPAVDQAIVFARAFTAKLEHPQALQDLMVDVQNKLLGLSFSSSSSAV